MRIYLIGMPGTGKSTVGKALALKLNYQFIDLDAYIEEKTYSFIDQIINQYGEHTFRAIETECLNEIKNDKVVIATGGGIVMDKQNKVLMKGIKIYLDTPLETIKKRLENSYQRPLLLKETLESLFDKRFLKYQDFADIIISNSDEVNKTVSDIMNGVKGLIGK